MKSRWSPLVLLLTVSLSPAAVTASSAQDFRNLFGLMLQAAQEGQRRSASAKQFQLPRSQRWLALASRATPAEAAAFAEQQSPFLSSVIVVRSENGWYAILGGIVPAKGAEGRLDALKTLRLIPRDAYLSEGGAYRELVWAPEGNADPSVLDQQRLRSAVARIQEAMADLGFYKGAVDGVAGPQTAKAFSEYAAQFDGSLPELLSPDDVGRMEALAQTGFGSEAEYSAALASGFSTREEYEEAASGGFRTLQDFEDARAAGFSSRSEMEAAHRTGFETRLEYEDAQRGGFRTKREYDDAKSRGFSNLAEMQEARNAGFSTEQEQREARAAGFSSRSEQLSAKQAGFNVKAELDRAHEAGFRTRADQEHAAKAGFLTKADYDAFTRSGFRTKEEYDQAKDLGYATSTEFKKGEAEKREAAVESAALLLSDVEAFLKLNPGLPEVLEVASAVSGLQAAVTAGPASKIDESRATLEKIVRPLGGFQQFANARIVERRRAEDKALAELIGELEGYSASARNWIALNLTAEATHELLPLVKKLDSALRSPSLRILQPLGRDFEEVLARYDLQGEIAPDTSSTEEQSYDDKPSEQAGLSQSIEPNDTNRFLIEGDLGDIVVLYNASISAPHVYRNLRGDLVFENGVALGCDLQGTERDTFYATVERDILESGLEEITISDQSCSPEHILAHDLIIVSRQAFLNGSPSTAIDLLKHVATGDLREYRTFFASELSQIAQREQVRSQEIETDIDKGLRRGFGVVAIPNGSTVICAVASDRQDGHTAALNSHMTRLADELRGDPAYLFTSPDAAFAGMQRGQCGATYAEAEELARFLGALRLDNRSYRVLPIWIEETEVAVADEAAIAERERIAREEEERRREAEEARLLAAQRERDAAETQQHRQALLQEKHGAQARALKNEVHSLLDELTVAAPDQGTSDLGRVAQSLFPEVADWHAMHVRDRWEMIDLDTEVDDYGVSDWKGRRLEALAVRAKFRTKNRLLGEYKTECYIVAVIVDSEFSIYRAPISVDCSNSSDALAAWKRSHGFESRWLAS